MSLFDKLDADCQALIIRTDCLPAEDCLLKDGFQTGAFNLAQQLLLSIRQGKTKTVDETAAELESLEKAIIEAAS